MPFQKTTPGDGYMLGGKPYVYLDTMGTAAPAMRDPTTNKWVADRTAMSQMGMAQPAKSIAPEDQQQLDAMGKDLIPARQLAIGANQFMQSAKGVPLGPRWGALPIFGGDAQSAMRKQLASTDPAMEAKLEDLEGINSKYWALNRPPQSGKIMGFDVGGTGGAAAGGGGWKTAFPSIVNMGPADQAIRDRLWQDYADKTNLMNYTQQQVHSGQATAAQAQANFQNMQSSPAAAGRHQALGAMPGDFSGLPPGWQNSLAPKQLQTAKLYAGAQAAPGTIKNPFVPRSTTEAQGLPANSYMIDDDGTVKPTRSK
jgi:hypothetical protein